MQKKSEFYRGKELSVEELESQRTELLPERIEMRHRRHHLSRQERRLLRWALRMF